MPSRRGWLKAFHPALPLAFTVTLATCATNPVTGKRELSLISESQEIQMGQEAAKEVVASIPPVADNALQSYVSGLGTTLARTTERPSLPWTFTVIDDPQVNAFALPGGPIFITRGILTHMNSEAQLVSVLGHEIGHVTAKHSVHQMSQAQLAQIGLIAAIVVKPGLAQFGDLASQGMGLLFLKFGRDDESQADQLGFRYMTTAGYSPTEMAEMFRTLERLGGGGEGRVPEWLSTHPDPGNRVQATLNRIASASLPANLKVERDAFIQRTDGMIFGENPRLGFFRQTQFLHPDLKFQFDFPSNWKTQNQASAVVGVSSAQDAIIALSLAGTAAPSQALNEFMNQQGVQNQGGSSGSINGLAAASGTFAAQTQDGVLQGNVAFVSLDGNTYRLLAYTPQQQYNSYRGLFAQSLSSFRRLTDQAALNVQPVRIRLVRIPRAMTIAEFNQAYPSTIPLAQVALINGVLESATIPSGTLLKRVQ